MMTIYPILVRLITKSSYILDLTNISMTKNCTYCNTKKPLIEFSIKKNGLLGRGSICKECIKLKVKIRNEKNLEIRKNSSITEKKCSKCNKLKCINDFAKDINKCDGLYSSCKDCNQEYIKKYRKNNKEKIAETKSKSVLKNTEHYTEYKKEWYNENKEVLNKRSKDNYELNKEEFKKVNKIYRVKKRQEEVDEFNKILNKECPKCKVELPKSKFKKSNSGKFGLATYCINCQENSKLILQEKRRLRSLKYYEINRIHLLKDGYQRKKEKLKTDPLFKLKHLLSHRIRRAIYDQKGMKSGKTIELLGCTILEARNHIEKQFKDGMHWENHGNHGWHIDHIKPCSSFDLTKKEEQNECFNFKNLQPLWALENLKKGNKYGS